MNTIIDGIKEGSFVWVQGELLPQYFSLKYHLIRIESMPIHFLVLLLLHEDDRFLSHRGFNVPEILQSIKKLLLLREFRGGSSISQQLAKNIFTRGGRTPLRKLQESLGAVIIEHRLKKSEILSLYLAVLKFSYPVYGIREAATLIGVRHLERISPEHSAVLVHLISGSHSKLSRIRNGGPTRFEYSYTYEKLLAMLRIFHFAPEIVGTLQQNSEECLDNIARVMKTHAFSPSLNITREQEIALICQATHLIDRVSVVVENLARTKNPAIKAASFLAPEHQVICHLLFPLARSIVNDLKPAEQFLNTDLIQKLVEQKGISDIANPLRAREFGLQKTADYLEKHQNNSAQKKSLQSGFLGRLLVRMSSAKIPCLFAGDLAFSELIYSAPAHRSIDTLDFITSHEDCSKIWHILESFNPAGSSLNYHHQSTACWHEAVNIFEISLHEAPFVIRIMSLSPAHFLRLHKRSREIACSGITGVAALHVLHVLSPLDLAWHFSLFSPASSWQSLLTLSDWVGLVRTMPHVEMEAALNDAEYIPRSEVTYAMFFNRFLFDCSLPESILGQRYFWFPLRKSTGILIQEMFSIDHKNVTTCRGKF